MQPLPAESSRRWGSSRGGSRSSNAAARTHPGRATCASIEKPRERTLCPPLPEKVITTRTIYRSKLLIAGQTGAATYRPLPSEGLDLEAPPQRPPAGAECGRRSDRTVPIRGRRPSCADEPSFVRYYAGKCGLARRAGHEEAAAQAPPPPNMKTVSPDRQRPDAGAREVAEEHRPPVAAPAGHCTRRHPPLSADGYRAGAPWRRRSGGARQPSCRSTATRRLPHNIRERDRPRSRRGAAAGWAPTTASQPSTAAPAYHRASPAAQDTPIRRSSAHERRALGWHPRRGLVRWREEAPRARARCAWAQSTCR